MVSYSKTESLFVNEKDSSGMVKLQGAKTKKMEDFRHLGSTVQSNRGKEVKRCVHFGGRKVLGVMFDKSVLARMKERV